MLISVNMEPETRDAAIAALDALRAELEAEGVPVKPIRDTNEKISCKPSTRGRKRSSWRPCREFALSSDACR